MLRVCRLLQRPSPSGGFGGLGSFRGFQQMFSWYPRRGGEFLGDMLAGHNVFIADIPKRYDAKHARHFALVESLAATPLFALSIVHYVSSFFQHPKRVPTLVSPMMRELSLKAEAQHEWHAVVAKTPSPDGTLLRVGSVVAQVVLFPLWMLLASLAPQMVHAMLERVNHILFQKYKAISANGVTERTPAFVAKLGEVSREAEAFHSQQLTIPTDYATAALLFLIILYLTS